MEFTASLDCESEGTATIAWSDVVYWLSPSADSCSPICSPFWRQAMQRSDSVPAHRVVRCDLHAGRPSMPPEWRT